MRPLDYAALKQQIAEISGDFSLRLVLLFGSQATGAAGEGSDIDIAVLVKPSVRVDLGYDLSLQSAFVKILQTDRLDLVYLHKVTPLLRHRVVCQAVVLYDEDGFYARYASYVIRYYGDTRKFRALEREFVESFVRHGN